VVLIKIGVDAVVREGGPMLTVVQDADEANGNEAGQRSLLDEIDRDGARQMLAAAWQAEVAAYVEQFADQRDDNVRRLVLRNGYHQPCEVLTAAGAVEVTAPRVNAVPIPRPVSASGFPRRSSRPGRAKGGSITALSAKGRAILRSRSGCCGVAHAPGQLRSSCEGLVR
jgi:hypothetical protein